MKSQGTTGLSDFRGHWSLAPGRVFLNHGSFGACPKEILQLQTALRRRMERAPVQFLWRDYEKRLEPARLEVARFVGARPKDLVFVTNATTGVNAVLQSARLKRGDELLTTSHDYNACHNVLLQTARRTGCRVVVAQVPFPIKNPGQILDSVLGCVTQRTRLAMIDHVTSSTALVFPVYQLLRELERRGVTTLVDGAHAPGMVSLNLSRLAPCFYTANLHKWVCAPKGAAFLWAREDQQGDLYPAVVSHGNNTPRPGYSSFQDRFDWAGTADPTAWFCAGAAIRWMESRLPGGWLEVRHANHQLALNARNLLAKQLQVELPCPNSFIGSMATLPLPEKLQGRPKQGKIDPEQLRLFDAAGIDVPFFRVGRPERRYFRISAQLYNTLSDYERLADALISVSS